MRLHTHLALPFATLSIPVSTPMLHCLLQLSPFQSALVCCTAFLYSLHSSQHSYVALSFATFFFPVCTRMLHCLLLLSPFQSALASCTAFRYSLHSSQHSHVALPFTTLPVPAYIFKNSMHAGCHMRFLRFSLWHSKSR